MASDKLFERKLFFKQLQLSSLLELTTAINANLPEDSLYLIYRNTLLASLSIKKMALFVNDANWICKAIQGVDVNVKEAVLPTHLLELDKASEIELQSELSVFKYAVPVKHKNKLLAVCLLDETALQPDFDLNYLQTISNITLVAIENKKLARKNIEQEALRKEIEIAKNVQMNLIPDELPNTHFFSMYASYYPNSMVGGDYYDFIQINEHQFFITIADVSGKGIPAALLMSNFQATLRTLVTYTKDLIEITHQLNKQVHENAKGEKFITCFLALVDTQTNTITSVNAGHNPPYFAIDQQCFWLEKGTCILGMFPQLPFIEVEEIKFDQNFHLFLYTDGVSEVMNNAGDEFGQEGIQAFLEHNTNFNLVEVHEQLYSELHTYKESKSFPDDITYMSCIFNSAKK